MIDAMVQQSNDSNECFKMLRNIFYVIVKKERSSSKDGTQERVLEIWKGKNYCPQNYGFLQCMFPE